MRRGRGACWYMFTASTRKARSNITQPISPGRNSQKNFKSRCPTRGFNSCPMKKSYTKEPETSAETSVHCIISYLQFTIVKLDRLKLLGFPGKPKQTQLLFSLVLTLLYISLIGVPKRTYTKIHTHQKKS